MMNMSILYLCPRRLCSLLLPFFILFSVIANTDNLSVPPGSFYLYEIELDKGVTFRGKINLSEPVKQITVEVYDVSGELIEKVSVLSEVEISFVSTDAGMYDIRFHNIESEKSVELTFSYDVKRDFPVIPAFPIWSIVIGISFFLILKTT